MSKNFTVLAVSPTPECLVLAARCRSTWQRLDCAGANLIERVLAQCARDPAIGKVVLLVYKVSNPSAVHGGLELLVRKGVEVVWVAPSSKSVQQSCAGLAGVKLVTGPSMREAFDQSGMDARTAAGLVDLLDGNDSPLDMYLRYKIAMSLFQEQASQPLEEAADALSGMGNRKFEPKQTGAQWSAALRYKEAEHPFLAGFSKEIRALTRRVRLVAATRMSTLVLGETGTGKENVAFFLHEFSNRNSGPMVTLNCAGLNETLLQSELFGHKKGAFTGAVADKKGLVELANGGTLFLDEVAEMPLPVQAMLLRFLQNKKFIPLGDTKERSADVRVVAATQPGLADRIDSGRFRRDLYYRLAEVEIRTPALREIPDDIPFLVEHILQGERRSLPPGEFRAAQDYFRRNQDLLKRHAWPGNVRELLALVRRRALLGDDVVSELALGSAPSTTAITNPDTPGSAGSIPLPNGPSEIMALDDVLRTYAQAAWKARGSTPQQEVADALGKALNTVKRLIGPGTGPQT